MKHTSESGRSLLEMLGVIGIISVLTLGAITSAGFAGRFFRATKLHIEVEEIAANILDLYSWSRNFGSAGDFTSTLCSNDVFPEPCESGAGVSPWKGAVTAASTGDGFTITYKDVDKFFCQQIASNYDKYQTVKPNFRDKSACGEKQDIVFTY